MGKLISMLGIPGAGKSTQIRLLSEQYKPNEIIIASIPGMVKGYNNLNNYLTNDDKKQISLLKETTDECREKGLLGPFVLDKILFSLCLRMLDEKKLVVMDGCPRGLKQAKYLWSVLTPELKSNYIVILFEFPSAADEMSYNRQFTRALKEKGLEEANRRVERFNSKINIFNEDTMAGVQFLRNMHQSIYSVDCTRDYYTINSDVANIIAGNQSN